MSRCSINRFKSGGRCGGDSGAGAKENTSGMSKSFSELLAAREAQDRIWTASTASTASTAPAAAATPEQPQKLATPALTQMMQQQGQIVVHQKSTAPSKDHIMNLILQGDMDDE